MYQYCVIGCVFATVSCPTNISLQQDLLTIMDLFTELHRQKAQGLLPVVMKYSEFLDMFLSDRVVIAIASIVQLYNISRISTQVARKICHVCI